MYRMGLCLAMPIWTRNPSPQQAVGSPQISCQDAVCSRGRRIGCPGMPPTPSSLCRCMAPGIDEGVRGMREGGVRRILVPGRAHVGN